MLTFLIVCAGNEPKDKGRTIMEENLKIPAHVALILADLMLDPPTIAAGPFSTT